jgi:methylated-DNA-protein-cysteine methyltransferase-like protein
MRPRRPAARKASSPAGTHVRIFAAVRRIPRGRVSSYGEVAAIAGLPGHARLVGYALHASPTDALPWHRVVNARGELSLARIDPDGALTQRLRLEREGVAFDAGGRVRMEVHRWNAKRRARPAPAGRTRRSGAPHKSRAISSEA